MLYLRQVVTLFVYQSLVFSPLGYADQLSLPSNDLFAPEISHEAISATLQEGVSLQLHASVTDNYAVKSVTLYYRITGSNDYKNIAMQRIEESNNYSVTIGHDEMVTPGIEYYIQAMDLAGNTLLHGYSFSPLKVSVNSSSQVLRSNGASNALASDSDKPTKKTTKKWLWIGLGVLAVGVIAATTASGSGDGGDPNQGPSTTGSLDVSAPAP